VSFGTLSTEDMNYTLITEMINEMKLSLVEFSHPHAPNGAGPF
jgi:hypothetical protein